MRASETTVIPTSRARGGNGTARANRRRGRLWKATALTAPVVDDRSGTGVAPADADYFVHPFVD